MMVEYVKQMVKKQTKRKAKPDIQFILANERTLLAWIRTGLTLIAGGVAIAFLASNVQYGVTLGLAAILAGGFIALVGYSKYKSADAAVRKGRLPKPGGGELAVVVGVSVIAAVLVVVRMLNP